MTERYTPEELAQFAAEHLAKINDPEWQRDRQEAEDNYWRLIDAQEFVFRGRDYGYTGKDGHLLK